MTLYNLIKICSSSKNREKIWESITFNLAMEGRIIYKVSTRISNKIEQRACLTKDQVLEVLMMLKRAVSKLEINGKAQIIWL